MKKEENWNQKWNENKKIKKGGSDLKRLKLKYWTNRTGGDPQMFWLNKFLSNL
jgi:hypothetical protein